MRVCLTVLDKSNIGGLLTEALTADVQAVFADETSFVGADTAGSGAFSVGARSRVPDGFVRHFEVVVDFFGEDFSALAAASISDQFGDGGTLESIRTF